MSKELQILKDKLDNLASNKKLDPAGGPHNCRDYKPKEVEPRIEHIIRVAHGGHKDGYARGVAIEAGLDQLITEGLLSSWTWYRNKKSGATIYMVQYTERGSICSETVAVMIW